MLRVRVEEHDKTYLTSFNRFTATTPQLIWVALYTAPKPPSPRIFPNLKSLLSMNVRLSPGEAAMLFFPVIDFHPGSSIFYGNSKECEIDVNNLWPKALKYRNFDQKTENRAQYLSEV